MNTYEKTAKKIELNDEEVLYPDQDAYELDDKEMLIARLKDKDRLIEKLWFELKYTREELQWAKEDLEKVNNKRVSNSDIDSDFEPAIKEYVNARLKNKERSGKCMWCIIHNDKEFNTTDYLAWQQPGWEEDGYFWTSKEGFKSCLCNNTDDHPFLFPNRKDAITFLKSLNIPQCCSVVLWQA